MQRSRIGWFVRVGLATMMLAAAGLLADQEQAPAAGSGGAPASIRLA